jgi:hypothetical protein
MDLIRAVKGGDLIDAVRGGDLFKVKFLLDKGADVNYSNSRGWFALLFAVEFGGIGICMLLLESGANVNQSDEEGWTPLMYAVFCYKINIIKLLLVRGANVNYINKYGATALSHALRKPDIFLILRWRGAKFSDNKHTNIDGLILLIYRGIIPIDILREIHRQYYLCQLL